MADFTIKQSDTLPVLVATLFRGDGTVQDLTGATVTLRMETLTTLQTVVNEGPCTILSPPTAGVVQYAWQATDTATPGYYLAEFHVTLAGGTKATFPTIGKLLVYIEPRLA